MSLTAAIFRIRTAVAADAPALAALIEQLGYPATVSAVEHRLARLAISGGDEVLLAECAGVGVVGALVLQHRATLVHDEDVAQVTTLVVDERRRGAGIGSRLLRAALVRAREWGCSRVVVTTHLRREEAHRFYERHGFEHTGRRYVLTS